MCKSPRRNELPKSYMIYDMEDAQRLVSPIYYICRHRVTSDW
nr:MAG TPA: hypothetical protein [Caudoviricetes sp.]